MHPPQLPPLSSPSIALPVQPFPPQPASACPASGLLSPQPAPRTFRRQVTHYSAQLLAWICVAPCCLQAPSRDLSWLAMAWLASPLTLGQPQP